MGLAQNFNFEIQPEPFLIEAVDQMLNKIGEDEQIWSFLDYVNYSLDQNDRRWSTSKNLLDSAKNLWMISIIIGNFENKDFDWKAYENTKITSNWN